MFDPAMVSSLLNEYSYWFVYVGTLIAGEIVIIPSFVLAGQGVLNIWIVFLVAVLGTLTTDTFWFFVGRFSLRIFGPPPEEPPTHFLIRLVHNLTERHLLLTLTVSKFIIGGRLLTILYLARRGISPVHFWPFDVIGVSLFVLVLLVFGWTSGKGIEAFFPGHGILATIGLCIGLLLILFVGERLMRKFFN